jgi:hypothetical protein
MLNETIYVKQPEGFTVPSKENYIYLLRKALYELKPSPHIWFYVIAEVLTDLISNKANPILVFGFMII